jgi:hypothetical protein
MEMIVYLQLIGFEPGWGNCFQSFIIEQGTVGCFMCNWNRCTGSRFYFIFFAAVRILKNKVPQLTTRKSIFSFFHFLNLLYYCMLHIHHY